MVLKLSLLLSGGGDHEGERGDGGRSGWCWSSACAGWTPVWRVSPSA